MARAAPRGAQVSARDMQVFLDSSWEPPLLPAEKAWILQRSPLLAACSPSECGRCQTTAHLEGVCVCRELHPSVSRAPHACKRKRGLWASQELNTPMTMCTAPEQLAWQASQWAR